MAQTPKVTFLPLNRVCEAKSGWTLLDTALNFDIPIQHSCGGFCACTTCQVVVREGAENLSSPELEEREIMGDDPSVSGRRLGCQAKVLGDVTVEIVNLE